MCRSRHGPKQFPNEVRNLQSKAWDPSPGGGIKQYLRAFVLSTHWNLEPTLKWHRWPLGETRDHMAAPQSCKKLKLKKIQDT